jgi:glutamate/tyrosine decarboxylase-like PLP-dependent enzyme
MAKFSAKFPTPLSADEVFARLKEYSSKDFDPHSGRMWGHVYATGRKDVVELARKAFLEFMDKTMLDFTTYPSVLKMENEIVSLVADLMNGKSAAGNFTYGGTESIMLAVKAAREEFKKRENSTPEIVLPETAHPAFYKSAEFLGMKVTRIKVDRETFKASAEDANEVISSRTAILVASAPNYPFGVVDDVKGFAELAVDRELWLHVDACIGGFVLPFFRELGEDVPPFDFSVEGVSSISVDLHKYGYTPRGASVILHNNPEKRMNHIFVMASWPGYPIVNTAVLSTRSAGTLAASWAVMNYLGKKGYIELSEKILKAKKKLLRGLPKLGFKVLGEPESSLLTFSTNVDPFILASEMGKLGWYIQSQPGSRLLGYPKSIHLSISPYHYEVVDSFLEDLEKAAEIAEEKEKSKVDVMELLKNIDPSSKEFTEFLGIKDGELPEDMSLINELMHLLPPELVEEVFRKVVNDEVFKIS